MTEPLTAEAADIQRRLDMLVDVERNNRERAMVLDDREAELTRLRADLDRRPDELDARSKAIGNQQAAVTARERDVKFEREALKHRTAEPVVVPMKKRSAVVVPKAFADHSVEELNAMIAAGRGNEVAAMYQAAKARRLQPGTEPLPSDLKARAVLLSGKRRRNELTAEEAAWLDSYFQNAEAVRSLAG